ncbi:hypothetical protein BDZ89DRAFT_1222929, partial [Hymenopellis radicata]
MSNSFGYGIGGIHAQKPESAALPVSGRVSVYHPATLASLSLRDGCVSDYGQQLDGNLRVLGTNDDLTPPDALSLLPPGGYEYRVLGEKCTPSDAPRVLPAHWNVTAMGAQKFPVLNGSDFSTMVKAFDRLCIVTGIPAGCSAVTWFPRERKTGNTKSPRDQFPVKLPHDAGDLNGQEILRTFQKGENVAIIQEPASTKPTSPKRRRTTGGTNDGLNERGSGSDGRTDGHDDEALPTDGSESSDDTALESPPLDVYRWTEH